MTGDAAGAAARARRQPLVQRAARGSLAARGVVYVVLAYLTARLAAGLPSRHASSQGALTSLVREPAGPELVAVLALGFVAYAAWRLLQAASRGELATDRRASERGAGGRARRAWPAGGAERVGRVGIAVAYLFLAAEAVQTAVQGRAAHGSPTSEAARILAVPGGRELLFAIGLGVVVGGVGLVVWAALQRFEVWLPDRRMPGWAGPTARAVGTFGNVVRGAAFAGVGATLAAAAVVSRASDAKGLGSALASLSRLPWGRPLLVLTALGFAAFAAMSALEAAYREI